MQYMCPLYTALYTWLYAKGLRKFCGSVCNVLTLVMDGEIVLPRNVIVQSLNVDLLRVKL